ncbi:LysR family transcriptional regulator [Bacillus aquiflavi]|uniref:LysR family transcriptional regulator n=1 Tax=Bacillus aquiflavi TaxID=2672567 RepID=A0A6B3VZD9_9BACI|nr:LysR family transcriptional regulator [Bacillus aquiflavi]MBA4536346.1 LysR family transcriptional regulator [Bacillus aquiflavi]NEY80714.1 LysR family transcriptional regulator [Bacillus aquiflavi]UAC48042.1 LysR family transcriptional regulator [Bacillus aquiflavi]
MNLLSLRYFIEVAKTLNFTEASKNLHVSQPGISQQINLLEEKLGVKLLYRTTRKVELTEEGRYLFEKTAPSFDQIENTVFNVIDSKTLPHLVKIATIPSAASLYLPIILNQLHIHYPNIEFSIKETTSAHVVELIKNREYHLGFIRTPVNFESNEQEGIKYLELKRSPIRAVVSSDHRLASREKIKLKELSDDFFLHYDSIQSPALHQLLQTACATAGFIPKTICSGSELLTIAYLVSNNFGVTLMPVDMFKLIDFIDVKSLELEDIYLESSISAVWEDSPYIRLNKKHIVKLLANLKLNL